MPADLSDRAAVSALVDRVHALERPVDILVNNAGTIHRAPAVDHSLAAWDELLEVNLSAPFALTQALGAGMVARGAGKVIFTASLLSFQGGINVAAYTASKHAIAGLTKALANEWAPFGVNVNAIAPGYIATDNTQALRDDPARARAILERIPAGRWGTPKDIAGAVVFLASPAADYVNGTVLTVDGGWLGR
jgi:2-deoxy-D-gluconate 3-dehydrogenase